jgi:hypothetical protein
MTHSGEVPSGKATNLSQDGLCVDGGDHDSGDDEKFQGLSNYRHKIKD